MFNNYLKIAFRNLKNNFVFSFINIAGLTLGIACALLIFSFIKYELSIDSFHKEPQKIYQVFTHEDFMKNTTTPVELGPELKKNIPEVIESTRYHWPWGENFLSFHDITFNENKIRFVDPSFFKVFNFPLLIGDTSTALNNPNSIIISPDIARKYFGDQNPIGQVLLFNHQHLLTVTGVLKAIPSNSSLKFEILIPLEFNIKKQKEWYLNWDNLFLYTFIKVQEDLRTDQLNSRIARILNKGRGSRDGFAKVLPLKERYFLFYSDKTMVYVFSSISLFILIIACFNFMNLSTARSSKRAREIGLRKIVGASRKQMMVQFLGESVFLAFIAAGFAVLLYILLMPLMRALTGIELIINYPFLITNSLLFALCTGLLAGIYPAFFLADFKVVQAIKDKTHSGVKGRKIRMVTITLQFILSIMIIISMLTVRQQSDFILNHDIGYNKSNMVCIPMGGGSEKYFQVFKDELLKDPSIREVSATALELPFFNWRQGGFSWEGMDPNKQTMVSYNAVDYNFISTMEMHLVEGEDFIKGKYKSGSFIVNEEMAKLIGKRRISGMTLKHGEDEGKVVGVVKNFHFNSMQNSIEPLVLELMPENADNMLVRIRKNSIESALTFIEQTWGKIIPQYPYRYSYLEDDYQSHISDLIRTGYLLSAFSILAILISSLGLFGLSSYSVVQKTKEIGIRKVLGASVFNIAKEISLEFIYLVLIANILVWPLAYYVLNKWLQSFAYHMNLSLDTFILAGLSTLGIAILTICYQTIKAATANPIDSLRYE